MIFCRMVRFGYLLLEFLIFFDLYVLLVWVMMVLWKVNVFMFCVIKNEVEVKKNILDCDFWVWNWENIFDDVDVRVGDEFFVDGGMVRFDVIEKIGFDVKCLCIDFGLLFFWVNLIFWRDGSFVCECNVMFLIIFFKVFFFWFFGLFYLVILGWIWIEIMWRCVFDL